MREDGGTGLEQEKGNFRGRLFGGFNRRDVINYIEILARERGELEKENRRLRERVWELESSMADPEKKAGPEEKPAKARVTRAKSCGSADKRRKRCRRYLI